jgi:hypothetical protein
MQDNQYSEPGDVLFINSYSTWAKGSVWLQKQLDPDAARSSQTFTHVAVALDDMLALEAMPDPAPGHSNSISFMFPDSVAKGEWTEAELRGGVRLIPIPDLVIPAMRSGATLIVLRSGDTAARSSLTATDLAILRRLGSEYSLDDLKAKAERRFGERITRAVSSRIHLTSSAADLATHINVDDALRKQIEVMFPDYIPPDEARSFFCSQVVIPCLTQAGILTVDTATELTTPTGLYQLLSDRNWLDVSALYHCAPEVERYFDRSALEHWISYMMNLGIAQLAIKNDFFTLESSFLASGLKAMDRICARAQATLDRAMQIPEASIVISEIDAKIKGDLSTSSKTR